MRAGRRGGGAHVFLSVLSGAAARARREMAGPNHCVSRLRSAAATDERPWRDEGHASRAGPVAERRESRPRRSAAPLAHSARVTGRRADACADGAAGTAARTSGFVGAVRSASPCFDLAVLQALADQPTSRRVAHGRHGHRGPGGGNRFFAPRLTGAKVAARSNAAGGWRTAGDRGRGRENVWQKRNGTHRQAGRTGSGVGEASGGRRACGRRLRSGPCRRVPGGCGVRCHSVRRVSLVDPSCSARRVRLVDPSRRQRRSERDRRKRLGWQAGCGSPAGVVGAADATRWLELVGEDAPARSGGTVSSAWSDGADDSARSDGTGSSVRSDAATRRPAVGAGTSSEAWGCTVAGVG